MNIASWLQATALKTPDAPALFTGSHCAATYGQFVSQVVCFSDFLVNEYGVSSGDRVAVYMANRIEYLIVMYASWWIGAVVVPINHKLHSEEAAWIIRNAEASMVITDKVNQFEEALLPGLCREVGLDELTFQPSLGLHDLPAPSRLESGTVGWLFYTSGTTGRPKGVMLTHGNLAVMSMCYLCDVESVSAKDSWLYAAPMSHGAGLYNIPFVRAGARHVVPDSRGFDSAEIFSLARVLDRVSLFAAPTMVKRMVRSAPAEIVGLNTIVYGGGPMYTADLIDALDRLGPHLTQIYGQGESPMTITSMSKDLIANREGVNWKGRIASVGTAQSCMEIRIVDEYLTDMPIGKPGEIVVRGPAVMNGYWKNEEATRKVLRNGWLFTGDIGFLDGDGFLTLTDRSRDVIISGGTNIYPREVEEVLSEHPGIAEVAVIGAPNAEWGEEVVAFVVALPGADLSEQILKEWCRSRIASFKKPKRYIFSDSLPKNSYGKIMKQNLRGQ